MFFIYLFILKKADTFIRELSCRVRTSCGYERVGNDRNRSSLASQTGGKQVSKALCV